jgi:hypothetical protein
VTDLSPVELDCRNVPGHLIRRDETEHALATRAQADEVLRAASLETNRWRSALGLWVRSSPDCESWVLVPSRSKRRDEDRRAIAELRRLGLAS